MRAFKKSGNRGFTLVELMIVVAIIGVLAALAIYGVRRYLASAKTSEAKNTIGAIARNGAAAFERETVDSELVAEGGQSAQANHAFCTDATAVPATMADVQGKKYQPNSATGQDFEVGDHLAGWKCLKFSMNQPIYYQYNYNRAGGLTTNTPPVDGFEAAAKGDLNGDGTVFSEFSRIGEKNADGASVRLSTQIYVHEEFE